MGMTAVLIPLATLDLQRIKRDPDAIAALLEREEGVSLDKMWHALHFMLTGRVDAADPPLGDAILGGTETGDDLGLGPARVLTPEQVRAVDQELAHVTRHDLRDRFRPILFADRDLYPQMWDQPREELLALLTAAFDALVDCYRAAAARGDGMLLTLR